MGSQVQALLVSLVESGVNVGEVVATALGQQKRKQRDEHDHSHARYVHHDQ